MESSNDDSNALRMGLAALRERASGGIGTVYALGRPEAQALLDRFSEESLNGAAIHAIREACTAIMGGNLAFVDDDFARCLLNLKDENERLRHDLERSMANHNADLNSPDETTVGGWVALSECEPPADCPRLIVTNRLDVRDALGHLHHLWLTTMVHKQDDGSYAAFSDDSEEKIHGLTHWRYAVESPTPTTGEG